MSFMFALWKENEQLRTELDAIRAAQAKSVALDAATHCMHVRRADTVPVGTAAQDRLEQLETDLAKASTSHQSC